MLHSYYDCYPDHLQLHSYPTRRSSDLPHLHDPAQGIDRRRDVPHGVPRPIPDEEVVAANVVLLHRGSVLGPRVGDRKSTRLNSSHANISYAVFCLKKINMYTI